MMNPELKKKWIDALRSGEYVQINGQLETISKHCCCLGVLGHVALPTTPLYHDLCMLSNYLLEAQEASMTTRDKALLPLGLTWGEERHLASMNDKNYSFAEIADWIEENL